MYQGLQIWYFNGQAGSQSRELAGEETSELTDLLRDEGQVFIWAGPAKTAQMSPEQTPGWEYKIFEQDHQLYFEERGQEPQLLGAQILTLSNEGRYGVIGQGASGDDLSLKVEGHYTEIHSPVKAKPVFEELLPYKEHLE